MKILVIDDEKPTLSMFKLFLTAYGYEVSVAEDGEQGLETFKAVHPDIVFTDIKMPGIDGLEVLKKIREMSRETQVIIITGHGDMEKAVVALDLEASDFINKPVERQALNSALARAEKRRQLPLDNLFSFRLEQEGNHLNVHISGRLTGEKPLDLIGQLSQDRFDTIRLITDDSFSITRSGISTLIAMVRSLNSFADHITIENLSYSYARVFQMAELDKLAVLVEEELSE